VREKRDERKKGREKKIEEGGEESAAPRDEMTWWFFQDKAPHFSIGLFSIVMPAYTRSSKRPYEGLSPITAGSLCSHKRHQAYLKP
jgi:hypothetical protein